jgi:hypothetical protein
MIRIVKIETKTGAMNVPFDQVFPTQNTKKYYVEFKDVKRFVPGVKKADVISIQVVDQEPA